MTDLAHRAGVELVAAAVERAKPCPKPKKRKQLERRRQLNQCTLHKSTVRKLRPRRKKSERRRWELSNLQLCKEIVLERDKGCVCPPPENGHSCVRQSGHVFSVVFGSVMFGLDNQNEQCKSCNVRHEWHPTIYYDWYKATFGQEKFDALWRRAQDVVKLTIDDLATINMELTEIQKYQLSHPGWKPYCSQDDILSGRWRECIEVSVNVETVS